MHVKYFQAVARIQKHYDEMLKYLDSERDWASYQLDFYGISESDRSDLEAERDIFHYLVSCQGLLARQTDAHKPTIETAQRGFRRHIHHLMKVYQCDCERELKRLQVPEGKLIQKEYEACRHYRFQFSLPGWYRNMPDVVLTYDHKYA